MSEETNQQVAPPAENAEQPETAVAPTNQASPEEKQKAMSTTTPAPSSKAETSAAVEEPAKLRPEIRPHAFVVMPFGKKKGGDGSLYDFNAIYKELIKPALESAGFEPFRADEETSSGDILTDMFQELLLADLVLCDLSIDNANAFYELGIRHAFRKRGVVHIQAGRAYMPFDIFNVRTLPYHVTPEGVPDPAFIEKDKQAIARMSKDTWSSDPDAIHSPIYNLLTGLPEPDRRNLRTPLATGFWREYNEWKERVTVAQRQKRIGDLLLLTEEITNPFIKEEAVGQAGRALANMGRHELALAQYRKGLEINPRNLVFRRQEAFHLNRLGKVDEAIVKIEGILADAPNDSESIAYLGRIYKEMWFDSWKWVKDDAKRHRMAYDSYHWLLKAYNIYMRGFRSNLNEYYPGVNALTLATILIHLADEYDDPNDPDPDIIAVRRDLPELKGALEFALESLTSAENADYWALVSLAELRVLIADTTTKVSRAYRKALPASRRNMFFIQTSLEQLEILRSLSMRPEFVQAGIKALREELARIMKEDYEDIEKEKTTSKKAEGMVYVFVGYRIEPEASGKADSNFPPEMEKDVKTAITAVLDKFNVGPNDLAIVDGMAAGGDLIFIESCVERGIPVEPHLPLVETAYVREFVAPAGDSWVERFYRARNHPLVDERYQTELVGKPKEDDDVHERNNRWAVYSSLVRGVDKVRMIALFDDKSGKLNNRDAVLVKHMVDLMRDTGGQIEFINPAKLKAIIANSQSSHEVSLEAEAAPVEKASAAKSKK